MTGAMSNNNPSERSVQMDKIERILWLICHAALTVIAVVITVRLCAGCASVKSESAKTNISAVLRFTQPSRV